MPACTLFMMAVALHSRTAMPLVRPHMNHSQEAKPQEQAEELKKQLAGLQAKGEARREKMNKEKCEPAAPRPALMLCSKLRCTLIKTAVVWCREEFLEYSEQLLDKYRCSALCSANASLG